MTLVAKWMPLPPTPLQGDLPTRVAALSGCPSALGPPSRMAGIRCLLIQGASAHPILYSPPGVHGGKGRVCTGPLPTLPGKHRGGRADTRQDRELPQRRGPRRGLSASIPRVQLGGPDQQRGALLRTGPRGGHSCHGLGQGWAVGGQPEAGSDVAQVSSRATPRHGHTHWPGAVPLSLSCLLGSGFSGPSGNVHSDHSPSHPRVEGPGGQGQGWRVAQGLGRDWMPVQTCSPPARLSLYRSHRETVWPEPPLHPGSAPHRLCSRLRLMQQEGPPPSASATSLHPPAPQQGGLPDWEGQLSAASLTD